jgi:Domain of unknown function (DUF4349)
MPSVCRMSIPLRVAAIAAMVFALAGCTSTAGSSSGGDSPGVVAPDQPADQPAGEPLVGQPAVGEDADGENRDVVVTGYLTLVTGDPLTAADDARRIVESAGGRLDGLTKEPPSDQQQASAQLVARIPSDRLDATLADLEELGTVQSLSTSSNDVTQQTTDLDARIASLQASVDRLRQLLTGAASTADLIAIETALSEREAELESLTQQRTYLADQVDYATVTIAISTPAALPTPTPTDFPGAVAAGFAALVAALGWTLVGIGAALPWVVFLGLVGALVFALVRVLRRRSRGRRPAEPEAPEAG